MKNLILLVTIVALAGCAQLGSKVEIGDDKYSERAYAQKAISDAEKSKYDSVTACVESCDVKLSDLSEMGEVAAVVAQAAGKTMDFCGCAALAATTTQGRNYFDAKTETAISRHQAVAGSIRSVGRVVTGAIIADAVVDTASAIATNSGDRYNVDIAQDNRTTNTGGQAFSSDGEASSITGGEGLPIEGEEGALAGGSTAGAATGTGGSGGGIQSDQAAMRNNVINIGGNNAIAGERSAAGDQAIVNGDSSVVSTVEDSELKAANIAEDVTTDQGEFDDRDGQNDTKLLDF